MLILKGEQGKSRILEDIVHQHPKSTMTFLCGENLPIDIENSCYFPDVKDCINNFYRILELFLKKNNYLPFEYIIIYSNEKDFKTNSLLSNLKDLLKETEYQSMCRITILMCR